MQPTSQSEDNSSTAGTTEVAKPRSVRSETGIGQKRRRTTASRSLRDREIGRRKLVESETFPESKLINLAGNRRGPSRQWRRQSSLELRGENCSCSIATKTRDNSDRFPPNTSCVRHEPNVAIVGQVSEWCRELEPKPFNEIVELISIVDEEVAQPQCGGTRNDIEAQDKRKKICVARTAVFSGHLDQVKSLSTEI